MADGCVAQESTACVAAQRLRARLEVARKDQTGQIGALGAIEAVEFIHHEITQHAGAIG
jgi:hypothetical protein